MLGVLALAVVLSLATFAFFLTTTTSVQNSALQATNENSQIEANNLANTLGNNLKQISDNLGILSESPTFQSGNATGAQQSLAAVQLSTANYTSSYVLVSANGTLAASSNRTALSQNPGNLSQRSYFVQAKNSGTTFIDPHFVSIINNRSFVVASRPVYQPSGTSGLTPANGVFRGVLVASVDFSSLGNAIKALLPPELHATVGFIDYNGTVLYSANATSIGKNIFAPDIRAQNPQPLRNSFYEFLNSSLSGQPAPYDVTYQGVTSAIASHQITFGAVLGNSTDSRVFAVLYIAAPTALAASQVAQINQLKTFTFSAIALIVAAAAIQSVTAFRRNRELAGLVAERTADLNQANTELREQVTVAEKNRKTAELMQDILTHDIRNYNQVIVTNAELLENKAADEKSKRFLDAIQGATEGSTELIQKTRLLARILSGEDMGLSGVKLRESLERSLSLVKNAFPDKAIELSSPDFGDAEVLANSLLDEVFVNVFSNAVKYTEKSKVPISIEIEAREEVGPNGSQDRKYWKVSITDQGRGIPDETKSSALMRYLGTARGRGLGLSIARALVVDAYSGRFELKNRVEGDYTRGTRVEIWLPMK